MPRLIRNTLVSVRDLIAAAGPFVLLALLLLTGAYFLLDPAPPKRVVLATGPEQSDYAEFGKRYAAELKRYGIEVVQKPTQGSSENRRLLHDPAQSVELAFVRGGSSDATRAAGVVRFVAFRNDARRCAAVSAVAAVHGHEELKWRRFSAQ